MKTLIIFLSILLTSCVTYKQNGEWVTEPLFWDTGQSVTESVRLTVHVVPQAQLDATCAKWGIVRACAIDGIAYIPGKPQKVTMKLSAEYINSLPYDHGKAGDMLADTLGLELGFNQRESLGHEALLHIFSDTRHTGTSTPHITGY